MPQFDQDHVKLCGGTVVWDGITRPDTIENGPNAGKPKWSLKVVFPPNHPDVDLYDRLAAKTLTESQFRGVLPAGGYMPVSAVRPGELGDLFPGWSCISFKTTMRVPDVYSESGQLLDPMQYGRLIYGGQRVDILAHCYEYNQKSRGIGAGLDAFAIISSAQAPRQAFGGGGIATAGAFGGGQQPAQQPTAAAGPGPQQATNFLPQGPGPGAGPQAEPRYQTHDGIWTRAQLAGGGYTPEQIAALPVV